jgi:hypothetical protein
MNSRQTTICGIVALVGGLLAQFFPEYARLGGFLAALGTGVGLMLARDNNKSSEQVGATSVPIKVTNLTTLLLLCFVLSIAVCLVGCARFTSRMEKKADGSVTSVQHVTTFWDSQNAVAKLKASSTEKTPVTLSVGSINEEATSTNITAAAGEMLGTALRALVKP